jgi:phosphotransferase family enzyme
MSMTEQMLSSLGLRGARITGSGMEHIVWTAQSARDGKVAVKVPRFATHSNANDAMIDGTALLRQEFQLTKHLYEHGIRVARPLEFIEEPLTALISAWVANSESAAPQQADLARLLREIHAAPVPEFLPMAHEGRTFADTVADRVRRRWSALRHLLGQQDLPGLALDSDSPASVLHLDFRKDNFRLDADGRVLALLDWSNCLMGPAAFELARAREYARYPGNGLIWDELVETANLSDVWRTTPEAVRVSYQLDAAVMLAVLFNFELSGSPEAGPALDRVRELTLCLKG